MPSSSDQTRVGRTLTLGGGAESSLEGRDIELSVSPKDIRTSPYNLCANRSDRPQSREGDRWFESTSLQRRVRCELRPGWLNSPCASGPSAHRFLRRRFVFAIARICQGASSARVPRPDIMARVERCNAAAFSMTMRLYSAG